MKVEKKKFNPSIFLANFWNLLWKSGDLEFFSFKICRIWAIFPMEIPLYGFRFIEISPPPPPQKEQCLGRAGLTSCPQKTMGGPEKAPPPSKNIKLYIYRGKKKAMTAISPLRGSFFTDYFSQRPFFLENFNFVYLFISLQYKPPSFFSGEFLPNEGFFKMAKDKCFWGFLLAYNHWIF